MIHAMLIAFHNPEQTLLRWQRDLLPGLKLSGHSFVVTVVDNSPTESPRLKDYFGADYLWQHGENVFYGGALNIAVPRHREAEFVLYCCSRHGYAIDPSWVGDIIAPMIADETVGQCGFLMGSNSPGGVAHVSNAPWIKEQFQFKHDDGSEHVPAHIQGGVFAARTSLMLRFPYPPEVNHLHTDHILTWNILKAGYQCITVPTICSLYGEAVRDRKGLKYVHDTSEEATRTE